MTRTYSQMHRKDKYSQHNSINWPVWLNGWVLVYELSGCGFESSCSQNAANMKITIFFGWIILLQLWVSYRPISYLEIYWTASLEISIMIVFWIKTKVKYLDMGKQGILHLSFSSFYPLFQDWIIWMFVCFLQENINFDRS